MLLSLVSYWFLNDVLRQKFKWFYAFGLQITFVMGAFILSAWHPAPQSKRWYGHTITHTQYLEAVLTDDPDPKAKTWKLTVSILSVLDSNHYKIPCSGNALLYVEKSDAVTKLKGGDVILFRNTLKDIRSSGNPGAFDFAAYARRNNIYQSAFLKQNDWVFTGQRRSSLNTFFLSLGRYTRKILAKYIHEPISLGIGQALLMGYRKDIDAETWQTYADAGIVHIIAISGMHMAMIYGTIRWMLMLIPYFRKNKLFPILFAILSMWIFAGLTGMPASVARAAVMFSFIGIGELIHRQMNVQNNLAASALFLLCINPFWLFDVGFQLSYLALISLSSFYKPIYKRIYFSHPIPDFFWKLSAGTVAAQILTFPICMFYFHQFPVLFLISNLIAIPLTTGILYAEILLVLLSSIPSVASFIGLLTESCIQFLNSIVDDMTHWSLAVWEGINLNISQVILIYLILFSWVWLYRNKDKMIVFASALLLLFLSISMVSERVEHLLQKHIIVFDAGRQKSLGFVQGENYFVPEENLLNQSMSKKYVLDPFYLACHVNQKDSTIVHRHIENDIEAFEFEGQTILRFSQNNFQPDTMICTDYLILSEQCNPHPDWLKKHIKAHQIIIDGSIPNWKTEPYISDLEKMRVHIVSRQGAYLAQLNT
ncbi:MAG: ComEC family competence protein [Chitinophagaceae bacterium]|nr:ComEC family competence protein [Chitinophagaceae bacterium]